MQTSNVGAYISPPLLPSAFSLSMVALCLLLFQDQKKFLPAHLAGPRSARLKTTQFAIRPKSGVFLLDIEDEERHEPTINQTHQTHQTPQITAISKRRYKSKKKQTYHVPTIVGT